MAVDSKRRLLDQLNSINAFKFGDFTLKSGQISPVYVDLRSLITHPKAFKLVISAVLDAAEQLQFDKVCGVPIAAIPIATGLMVQADKPMLLVRKEVKEHGTKKRIEGEFAPNDRVLVVEDVTVLGWSIRETVQILREHDLQTTDAITLVDRQQGGKDNLRRDANVHLHSILTLQEIFDYLTEKGQITEEQGKGIRAQLADTSYIKENNQPKADK